MVGLNRVGSDAAQHGSAQHRSVRQRSPRTSPPDGRPAPSLWRALAAVMVCGLGAIHLGRSSLGSAVRAAEGPVAVEDLVATAVTAVGTVACALLGLGALLLAASALTRLAGRSVRGLEVAATRLTPAVLRRAVAVTLTTGVGLTGAVGAASATEIDLGWAVTTEVGVGGQDAERAAPQGGTEPQTTEGVGAVVVQPVNAPVADDVGQPAASGRHAPSPLPETDAPGPAVRQTSVTVSPGDTLWAIAAEHLPDDATAAEIATAWPRWYALNESVIGTDPDLIRPGQQLLVPDEPVTEESR